MTPRTIQKALQGMAFTLCTYEHPAAHHEVEAWELAMKDTGRLLGKRTVEGFHLATAYRLERTDGGEELLYTVGLEDGRKPEELRSALTALTVMLTERSKLPRPWFKALHFGRIPTDDRLNVLVGHWMSVVHRPAACGHPVCRAAHLCLAPDIGSGGA